MVGPFVQTAAAGFLLAACTVTSALSGRGEFLAECAALEEKTILSSSPPEIDGFVYIGDLSEISLEGEVAADAHQAGYCMETCSDALQAGAEYVDLPVAGDHRFPSAGGWASPAMGAQSGLYRFSISTSGDLNCAGYERDKAQGLVQPQLPGQQCIAVERIGEVNDLKRARFVYATEYNASSDADRQSGMRRSRAFFYDRETGDYLFRRESLFSEKFRACPSELPRNVEVVLSFLD